MTDPGQEIVQIVDRDNREIGAVAREIMRAQNLIHRASYILVFDRAGRILVQQRTMGKDIYPGHLDIAAGGVVLAGESYEQAARRELEEELGIQARLRFHFDQYYEDDSNRVWGRIFSCCHEGPFRFQPEEVAAASFMEISRARAMSGGQPFTPDSLLLLARMDEIIGRAELSTG